MVVEPARPFDWNGPNGDRWVANQARLDRMLAPFGDALIAAADPRAGERALDIGCGAGASTFDLADAIGPRGQAVGLDISAALVARAETLGAERRSAAAFRLADAATADFAPEFDLVVSRFGVMFFDDPVGAFRNIRKAMRPGARLAFVCWRGAEENDWTQLPMQAIRDIAPPAPPPPPDAPGPFAFADRRRVAAILAEAGFVDIVVEALDHSIVFGAGDTRDTAIDDALANAVSVGPLERALAGCDAATTARAMAAARVAYARKAVPEGVVIAGAAWIVRARSA
ncbi:class I SAM-dependent methyltransferase [Brevundimonas sp.]|uniref:class I SAM-dependent methyltransferase n=1 Tax=Brevundimonas sp. TaxID=1871086 RepID=UPI0019884D81|nr:class I SAM-dependent methyltransferase [Brevundimonas sp.]MBD3835353.1 class I SAM-dependent methyltransferase [Brevundimonas sp.]